MRTRRGSTLLALLVGASILSMTMIAVVAMYLGGLRAFKRTSVRVDLAQNNAQGLRWVAKLIRQAATLSVSADGNTLIYSIPKIMADLDPLTGEAEYVEPIESDGVAHTLKIVNGILADGDNRVYVRNIARTDPDPESSQYNQVYAPFSVTTIGSKRAITVNLITAREVNGKTNYVRTKTTVMLRNAK